jgi:hypothetical protein
LSSKTSRRILSEVVECLTGVLWEVEKRGPSHWYTLLQNGEESS